MLASARAPLLLLSLGLLACSPEQGFVGTWQGTASVTAGPRTSSKAGAVIVNSATEGLLVTLDLPLPTENQAAFSRECDLRAAAGPGDTLTFSSKTCPPLEVSGGCVLALKVEQATGRMGGLWSTLKITGTGTVIATGCTASETFSFEVNASR